MQASAIKKATDTQIKALQQQRDFVFRNLAPEVVNEAARAADIERTQSRLALQSQIDPDLLATRFTTEANLRRLAEEGAGSQGDVLASQLFESARRDEPKVEQLRQKLLDDALAEIDAGATLPPDVQAELVRAGLERSGTVGTGASAKGLAGKLTRKLIGNEAIALKRARQEQATRLGLAAQELQNNRLNVLSTVFPQLKSLQAQNVATQTNLLSTANQLTPEAGLGGSDIANVFLARVGATNQIAQSAADTAARGAIQQATALQQLIGNAGALGGSLIKSAGTASGKDLTTAGLAKSIFG